MAWRNKDVVKISEGNTDALQNRVVNLEERSREIDKTLTEQTNASTSLLPGQNLVESSSSPAELQLQGRTLVNLTKNFSAGNRGHDPNKWGISQGASFWNIDEDNPYHGRGNVPEGSNWQVFVYRMYLKPKSHYLLMANTSMRVQIRPTHDTSHPTISAFALPHSSHPGDVRLKPLLYTPDSVEHSIRIDSVTSYGEFVFEKCRLYELNSKEYEQALTLSPEELDKLYPHVDGLRHIQNPFIKKSGKNLIPPFSHPSSKGSPYGAFLPATGSYDSTRFVIPVIPGETVTMTVKFKDNGTDPAGTSGGTLAQRWKVTANGGQHHVSSLDMNYQHADENGIRVLSRVVPEGMYFSEHYWWRNGAYSGGDIEIEWMQLEYGEGSTFEIHKNDYKYLNTTLASSLEGLLKDTLYFREGKYVKRKVIEPGLLIDGSFNMTNFENMNGLKRFKAADLNNVPNVKSRTTNIFGYFPKSGHLFGQGNVGQIETIYSHNDGSVSIHVPNSLSGYEASQSPTNAQVTQFFKDNPMILCYELSSPVEEEVKVEGSISLHEGRNLLEVSSGVIVREKIVPVIGITAYQINNADISRSRLSQKAKRILAIYRDGKIDNNWVLRTDHATYGEERMFCPIIYFDTKAEYHVTYEVSEKHLFTSGISEARLFHSDSLSSTVDHITKRNSDLALKVNNLSRQIYEMLLRLRSGGL